MERTEQTPDQPSPTQPRPHPFADQPATVQACAADYNSSAPTRAESVKRDARALRRGFTGLLLATVAALALTACSSDQPAVKPTPSAAPAPTVNVEPAESASDGVDRRKVTEIAVEMTWADATEQSKRDMCAGIDLFGTDWAADQLRDGGGDSDLDWDYAAVLIGIECDAR